MVSLEYRTNAGDPALIPGVVMHSKVTYRIKKIYQPRNRKILISLKRKKVLNQTVSESDTLEYSSSKKYLDLIAHP